MAMTGMGWAVRRSSMFTIWKLGEVSKAVDSGGERLHFILVASKILVT